MAGRNVDPSLTAEQLREDLHYDPETGIFTWRARSYVGHHINCRDVGKPAGSRHNDRGYMKIGWRGAYYFTARLAWLYMTGDWPKHFIDHIDGDPTNNRFANLRQATSQENSFNSAATRTCISAVKGARFHKQSGRYQASISINRKSYYLGLFDTPEEANKAYAEAARRLHGEFARTS